MELPSTGILETIGGLVALGRRGHKWQYMSKAPKSGQSGQEQPRLVSKKSQPASLCVFSSSHWGRLMDGTNCLWLDCKEISILNKDPVISTSRVIHPSPCRLQTPSSANPCQCPCCQPYHPSQTISYWFGWSISLTATPWQGFFSFRDVCPASHPTHTCTPRTHKRTHYMHLLTHALTHAHRTQQAHCVLVHVSSIFLPLFG